MAEHTGKTIREVVLAITNNANFKSTLQEKKCRNEFSEKKKENQSHRFSFTSLDASILLFTWSFS
jgi:hypothetical protein